jgi:diguanylate cyclase (GGDEF)-like protein
MAVSRQHAYLRLVTPFAREAGGAQAAQTAPLVASAVRSRFRTDPLCGVATRQVLLDRLETLGQLAPHAPLSFLVVKLHGLAAINHELGFREGDCALQAVAECVAEFTRATDVVGRLAGSTFGVVLQGSGATAAGAVAARLTHHLAQLQANSRALRVTVSAATGTGLNAPMLPHAAADSLGTCG